MPEPTAPNPFTWSDCWVAVVGGLIAAPLCDASFHAIVGERETVRGIIGLAAHYLPR